VGTTARSGEDFERRVGGRRGERLRVVVVGEHDALSAVTRPASVHCETTRPVMVDSTRSFIAVNEERVGLGTIECDPFAPLVLVLLNDRTLSLTIEGHKLRCPAELCAEGVEIF
jgi:hypothetical protein